MEKNMNQENKDKEKEEELVKKNRIKNINCKLYLMYEFRKKINNENNALYQITNPGIQELLNDYFRHL